MKQIMTFMMLFAVILFFSSSVRAEMDMGGMEMGKEKKEPSKVVMTPKTTFVKEILIEGVRSKFEIMTMAEHEKMMEEMKLKMEMSDKTATHHISVTFYDNKTGKEITDAQVNMKVVSPSKKEQIKVLSPMPEMKHYGNDFNLSEKGKYEILVLFKIGEQKRKGGFYYEVK